MPVYVGVGVRVGVGVGVNVGVSVGVAKKKGSPGGKPLAGLVAVDLNNRKKKGTLVGVIVMVGTGVNVANWISNTGRPGKYPAGGMVTVLVAEGRPVFEDWIGPVTGICL